MTSESDVQRVLELADSDSQLNIITVLEVSHSSFRVYVDLVKKLTVTVYPHFSSSLSFRVLKQRMDLSNRQKLTVTVIHIIIPHSESISEITSYCYFDVLPSTVNCYQFSSTVPIPLVYINFQVQLFNTSCIL